MTEPTEMIPPNDDLALGADPGYSIGTVAGITGIAESTLRIWERRYRFPDAPRSVGGHRRYAQLDVIRLQWVKLRMDAGARAGRAIQTLQLETRAAGVARALREPLPAVKRTDPALTLVRESLLAALLAYDPAVTAILRDAAAHHPIERVVLDVVGPTLATIGDAWSVGMVDVGTEHYATHLLRHQLLAWMRASPPPFRAQPVVLACAPEEAHEGGILILAVLLRRARWPVVYLGQSLPLAELPALVERADPAALVFAAMSEPAALALAEWPLWLPQREGVLTPIVGYGGRAFTVNPDLADSVPGVLWGSTLGEGGERIHRVMLALNALEPGPAAATLHAGAERPRAGARRGRVI